MMGDGADLGMGQILGIGLTHYPGLHMLDEDMWVFLRLTLSGKKVPERVKDPRNWPQEMRAEWADDDGAQAGRIHRERCLDATRALRERLDAFKPDFVLIFGDDQYENFVEDIVPPFCVFAVDEMVSQPFDIEAKSILPKKNIWGEGPETVFRHQGHTDAARWLVNRLGEAGMAVPYAYRLRYKRGLAHAFINTLLFLDVDRKGFPYKIVPFHVNCYGGDVIRTRGGMASAADKRAEADPSAPTPAVCFDMGAAVARALARSPWRGAMIATSSWSHAFLTAKNDWIYPDHASDRARLAELRENRYARWRELTLGEVEDAGQHEMLNWITLAGAMSELGRKVEIIDWVETYVMNSNKCFAAFPA